MCGLAFWLRYNHQVDWSGDVAEVFPEAQIEKASEKIWNEQKVLEKLVSQL